MRGQYVNTATNGESEQQPPVPQLQNPWIHLRDGTERRQALALRVEVLHRDRAVRRALTAAEALPRSAIGSGAKEKHSVVLLPRVPNTLSQQAGLLARGNSFVLSGLYLYLSIDSGG